MIVIYLKLLLVLYIRPTKFLTRGRPINDPSGRQNYVRSKNVLQEIRPRPRFHGHPKMCLWMRLTKNFHFFIPF